MKVFISWSGEASRRAADLLRKYLPCMIQDLQPVMSQHDLSSGVRWSEQLSRELEKSNFGIICLTPDNLLSPWVLFEAGALTKHVEGRACCLLLRGLGPADVSGPLAQFQNRLFSWEDFRKLIFDINALLNAPIEITNLQRIIEKWWPDLEEEVTAALADPELAKPSEHKRDQSDVLEELLLRTRSIQRILDSRSPDERAMGFSQLSLREMLDRTLSKLVPSQIAVLRQLVTPDGTAGVVQIKDLEGKYSKEDIDSLVQFGLIARRDNDTVQIPHSTIAHYIAEYLLAT